MAKPGRPSQEKRNRERTQKERFAQKQEAKQQRKEARAARASNKIEGYDPDLEGIFPGPHNNLSLIDGD